jgi:hypothetical protein
MDVKYAGPPKWLLLDPEGPGGGSEYAELIDNFRRLQDLLSGAAMPHSVEADLSAKLAGINEQLAEFQVPEWERVDGQRRELPGRGSPLLPAFVIDVLEPPIVRGRVTFGRVHLGGNGALHGGVAPLLFDEILGRVVHPLDSPIARTAYLKTDYRKITPIGVELCIEACLDEVEGRKRWASSQLRDAEGTVLIECTALFVELKPGQP